MSDYNFTSLAKLIRLLISHKVTNFQSNISLLPAYKIMLSDILHPNTDVGCI